MTDPSNTRCMQPTFPTSPVQEHLSSGIPAYLLPSQREALRVRHRLSVAPMMDWTDRHCRFFLRQISKQVLLYTEMVTTGALLHGDPARHLEFDPRERPLVLQLGGDQPEALATCARMAEDWGYDEVNLNVGCPSDRVQEGRFGACLMRTPERVAECVALMRARTRLPVTIKHRIGVDELDRYEDMEHFVRTVASAGCEIFIVHARKAWLSGLSPKENREIPPLRYADVWRLKQTLPALQIELNGGIESLEAAEAQLAHVDGVMIGRAAYHNPYLLADVDRRFYGETLPVPCRDTILEALIPYLEQRLSLGDPPLRILRHILGLYYGQPGTRAFKRVISEQASRRGAGIEVLRAAVEAAERSARESAASSRTFTQPSVG
ncbi:MAG: tRNA dihydrouridine(20/20a) synthase DusA [Myxococcota bacterium]